MTGDVITLTVPPERDFHRVVHLVLGGLAVRLNLTFDALEDLQLALDEVLGSRSGEHELTVAMNVLPDAIETSVGPFPGETLRRELERDGNGVGLRRVLATVVDRVEVDDREGGQWVQLTKRVRPGPREAV